MLVFWENVHKYLINDPLECLLKLVVLKISENNQSGIFAVLKVKLCKFTTYNLYHYKNVPLANCPETFKNI